LDNLEFLYPSETTALPFTVDEDVKELGLSNRSIALLEKCISMLKRGDSPDLAQRILKRYTTENFPDGKSWGDWLRAYQNRLYFTEIGGFKFKVAPELLKTRSNSDDATPQEPDSANSVIASAELYPANVRSGEELDVVVRVKTAPIWHIYAVGRSGGPGVPTTLELTLPKGVDIKSEWSCPDPIRTPDGEFAYEGAIEFRRRLRVGTDVTPGRIDVSCALGYQACNRFSCQLPTHMKLRASGEVAKGENADR
jgi:Disulphide bond corrector protein DsbC